MTTAAAGGAHRNADFAAATRAVLSSVTCSTDIHQRPHAHAPTRYVNKDYSLILEGGRADAYASLAASFAALTGYTGAPFAVCPLANVTLCPSLESGAPTVVLAYNALGQAAPRTGIRVAAGFPAGVASYSVFDAAGKAVTAQVAPLSARDIALRALYGGSAAPVRWLAFVGDLPAAGFSAFFLVPSATAVVSTHESVLTAVGPDAGDSTVSNGRVSLTVSSATGLLSGYADSVTGVSLPLQQQWLSYISFDGRSNLNGSNQASVRGGAAGDGGRRGTTGDSGLGRGGGGGDARFTSSEPTSTRSVCSPC